MKKLPLAIVTGGSSGIGKAICRGLNQEGYYVVNADVIPPDVIINDSYVFLSCDITQREQVHELSKLIEHYGGPDVLVLNAGQGIHEKLKEGDPEKWMDIINLNLGGTLRILRAILPYMNQGRVIFISSVSAEHPHTYGSIYAATKSALNTIAETLRLEESPDIGVTVISPGVVDTPFFDHMISGSHNPEEIGWGAIQPEEISEAVSFVLKQKGSTHINNITLRPSGQIL